MWLTDRQWSPHVTEGPALPSGPSREEMVVHDSACIHVCVPACAYVRCVCVVSVEILVLRFVVFVTR
eukprot:m.467617 g.467617  ORF g.467617 m.467617 type:complete len:67 (-) comp291022_c0_seq1:62-262(-)